MSANRRTPGVDGGLAALIPLAFGAAARVPASAQSSDKGTMQRVTSRDGTRIAYEKSGKGPAVILVNGALATRASTRACPAPGSRTSRCTAMTAGAVVTAPTPNPIRSSARSKTSAALIDAAGGSAYVYGKSSGASLALEAAASLGGKVKKLAIYEAPYSEAEGAAKEWKEFRSKLDALLAADRRADAVTSFMKFVGAPDEALAKMKASPAWPGMEAMAPTLAYDNAVVGDDRSVPVERAAKMKAATLVMDGGASVGPCRSCVPRRTSSRRRSRGPSVAPSRARPTTETRKSWRPSCSSRRRTAAGTVCSRSSFHDDLVGRAPPERLRVVHLLGLRRRHDERARRRRARDVGVVVDALPEERRERLDALVAQVLVLVPGAAPPPPVAGRRSPSRRADRRVGSSSGACPVTASAGFIASSPAGSGSTSATW